MLSSGCMWAAERPPEFPRRTVGTSGKPGGGGFSFTARQDSGSSSWLVGLDSYREIEIGGEPAVIVTGGWDAGSREWAWLEHTTLIWTVGWHSVHVGCQR
jgi:hypothetical protein